MTIRFDTYANAEESLCRVLVSSVRMVVCYCSLGKGKAHALHRCNLQEVEQHSPASLAGLQPGKDYLLGTAERVFKGAQPTSNDAWYVLGKILTDPLLPDPDTLHDELQKNIDNAMEIYVYK